MLENYFLPGDLEAFADNYHYQRYHESLNNVTPADVYFGRAKAILQQRERIKRKTLEARGLHHRHRAALLNQPDEPNTLLDYAALGSKNSDDGHVL